MQFDDACTEQEREIIYHQLGRQMQLDRWEKCQAIYRSAGANVTFKTFTGIGHGTNGRIHREIEEFFRQAMLAGNR